eukprot:Em0007g74a
MIRDQNPVEGTLYALNDLHNQMASSIVLDPCDNTTEDAMAAPTSVKLLCPSSPHLASCKRREMVDCFLPSQEDMNVVQSDMEVLVARILCDYIKDLRQLKKFVVTHIPHTYCDKMAEKSEVVVLDVLHKNETKSSDMVHIMREMASYLGGD